MECSNQIGKQGGSLMLSFRSRVVVIYLVVASAWILLSDAAVSLVFADAATISQWSMIKGMGFVVVTTMALYLVLRREWQARARAETALHASEERLQRIANTIEDVVYQVDVDTEEFAYVSPAFTRILGYDLRDVEQAGGRAKLLEQIIQDGQFTEQRRYLNLIKSRRIKVKPERVESWWRCKDGSLKCIEDHWLPVYSGDTLVSTEGVLRDITERKREESEQRQSQKMEVIGRLAGGVAHDFNNILQAISGFSDLLLMETPESDSRRKDIEEIQRAARRASDLTHQLLAFSRQQLIIPVVVDLHGLVSKMQDMMERLLGEDIKMITRLEAKLHSIKADPGQIEQVIMNLAINARDAMPEGGRLTISTTNITLDQPDSSVIPDAYPGKFICLAVSDSGKGMSKDAITHLFEPFFSTRGLGRGTGLGLAVIYGTAKQHNGWINVYSEEGHGSTFKLYLPVHAQADAAPAPAGTEMLKHFPKGNGKRILMVEDDLAVLNLGSSLLRNAGYEVCAAATAADALAAFETEPGRFDLLFSDVVLPDQNGIALADTVRSRKPDIPVLLCSGYTDERSRWSSIQEKGFLFLQKPYPIALLLDTVHTILDGLGATGAK